MPDPFSRITKAAFAISATRTDCLFAQGCPPQFRYKYAPGVTENTEHFFSLELPAECPVTVAPDEHLEYVWLPFEDAVERVFSWTNRDALLHLMRQRVPAPA